MNTSEKLTVKWGGLCGDGLLLKSRLGKINKGTEVIQSEDYKSLVPEKE